VCSTFVADIKYYCTSVEIMGWTLVVSLRSTGLLTSLALAHRNQHARVWRGCALAFCTRPSPRTSPAQRACPSSSRKQVDTREGRPLSRDARYQSTLSDRISMSFDNRTAASARNKSHACVCECVMMMMRCHSTRDSLLGLCST
jgi:hypothetical protein